LPTSPTYCSYCTWGISKSHFSAGLFIRASNCDTVELLRRETPQFISPDMWSANSPDLNPVNYRPIPHFGPELACTECLSRMWTSCSSGLLRRGLMDCSMSIVDEATNQYGGNGMRTFRRQDVSPTEDVGEDVGIVECGLYTIVCVCETSDIVGITSVGETSVLDP